MTTPDATRPELTVIVPCYNESTRLIGFFDLVRAERERPWEWLFVDDGSSDNTAARIEGLRAEVPDRVRLERFPRNTGKGAAVRCGILAARGKLCGYVDADLAASPLDFETYLADPQIRAGRTMLLGIRVKTGDGNVERRFLRHLVGRAFQTYTSVLTGLTVYDTQCGFKLLATDAAKALAEQQQCDGFAFDVELIMLARRAGMRIREEMIPWQEKSDSRIRLRHIFQMAWDILKMSRRLG